MLRIALSLLFMTSLTVAGEANFTGTGRIAANADYIMLSATVHSQCYAKPSDARNATDRVASDVYNLMSGQINNNSQIDEIVTRGGQTSRYDGHYNESRTHRVCVDTFAKTTTITLKTDQVENFGAIFDSIQDYIFENHSGKSNAEHTFVTLDSPSPQLTHAHQAQLEEEALAEAQK